MNRLHRMKIYAAAAAIGILLSCTSANATCIRRTESTPWMDCCSAPGGPMTCREVSAAEMEKERKRVEDLHRESEFEVKASATFF